MRIRDMIGTNRPVFSFEFFPPKTPQGEENLYRTINHLRELKPDFVSVTYGAGGTTREKTVELVTRIKREIGIEAMAHLTCVGASKAEIETMLQRLQDANIENLLALRGDAPNGAEAFVRPADGFAYATELVHFLRQRQFGFCVGGAAYPEGHIECADRGLDLEHLKAKVDAGLDFTITQLFFENSDYFSFVERARACGIDVPMIPGIMPITNVSQVERFTKLCGARIPDGLMERLQIAREDEEAVRAVGIDHATLQCRDLLDRGAPGIHFYTLNQSPATRAILERLQR